MVVDAHSAYSDLPYVPSEDTQAGLAPESQPPETHPTSAILFTQPVGSHTHATFTCITHGQLHLHLSVTYKPSITSKQTIPQCSSAIGQKKASIRLCSYVTDLSHLEKISCCSNHSASPCPPSPLFNKAYSVSRDKSPAPSLPPSHSSSFSLSLSTALVVCLPQVRPSAPTHVHLHAFITREQSPSNRPWICRLVNSAAVALSVNASAALSEDWAANKCLRQGFFGGG